MEKTTEGVPQGVKKPVPAAKPIPGLTLPLIPHKQYGVKQKHRQIQQAEVLTRMVLSVPKVMLKLIPPVLSYISMLVFYLPPRPPADRQPFPASTDLSVIQLL
jgi:hypothetical protein